MSQRIPYLDELRSRGTRAAFYDPEGSRFGMPTYPYHWAPTGLLTMRQLRSRGLRPGGQEIAAQILWRHHKQQRVAYLYDAEKAKPKREATPAQQLAIAKALAARRTCPTCGIERDYYIPRSQGECNPCADGQMVPRPRLAAEQEPEREAGE
jgi:hypothetical protein